jgi:hypothetical protein
MGKFSAAKIFDAVDQKFQKAYNYLIDLLETGYVVESRINDKAIKVTMTAAKPYEMSIDGKKQIYISSSGVLVPNIYDINEDGRVDQEDCDLLFNYILHGKPESEYLPRMDVNGDGRIDSSDLNLVYRATGTFGYYPDHLKYGDHTAGIDNVGFYTSNDSGETRTYLVTW